MAQAEAVLRYRSEGQAETLRGAQAVAQASAQLAERAAKQAQMQLTLEAAQRRLAQAYQQAQADLDAYAKASGVAMAVNQQQAAAAAAAAAAVEDGARRQAAAMSSAVDVQTQSTRAANDNIESARESAGLLTAAAEFAFKNPLAAAAGLAGATKLVGTATKGAASSFAAASDAAGRYAAGTAQAGSRVQKGAAVAADALNAASTAAIVTGKGFDDLSGKAASFAASLAPAGGRLAGLAQLALQIGPGLGAVGVGLLTVVAGALAVERAYADLDRLVALGERAERLDFSPGFVKSFEEVSAKAGIAEKDVELSLDKISGALREKYGQGSPLAKILDGLNAGGDAGLSDQIRLQAELATTTGQRFAVALDAMRELEASGKRLALLDLADKFFSADVVERLRTGQITVVKLSDDLDLASRKHVIDTGDVPRAVALQREIAAVKREIDAAWQSTVDFSAVGMRLNGVWLTVLKTVKDVVTTSDTNMADRLRAQVAQMENVAIPRAQKLGQADVVVSLTEAVAGYRAEIERLSSASRRAAPALDMSPQLRPVSEEAARVTAEAQRAATTIPGLDGALVSLAGSASNAAVKIGSVAEGIRALQGLNPNLAGALSYFDKVGQAQAILQGALKQATVDYNKNGNADAKMEAENKAAAEYLKTVTALDEQRRKPQADLFREADRAQLSDADRAAAQVGDRFAEARKEAEAFATVKMPKLVSPEDADLVTRQLNDEKKKLDVAQSVLEAKARADAAAKNSGPDTLDNAFKRIEDQTAELKLQADSLGKVGVEYYKTVEANQLWRAAIKAEREDEEGLSDKIDEAATKYAKQRYATEQVTEAHRRMQDAFREGGSLITDFLDAWILKGGKFADVLKSTAGTLASGSLKGLLTGEGMMGTILGLSPTEKGGMGGLLGGQGFSGLIDMKSLKDSVSGGAFEGITTSLEPFLKPKTNAEGKSMGFMSSPLGQGLGVGLAGASIGYSSGSPLMGALGGGLAGLMTGNPILAAVGAAGGLIGGLLGEDAAKEAKKKAVIEAQAQYQQNLPAIQTLRAGLRGEATGGVEGTIRQTLPQVTAAAQEAAKAGDQATVTALQAEYQTFINRARDGFVRGFEGMLGDLARGLGPNGPFAQASASVIALGEALKSFVADTVAAAPQAEDAARAAAQQAALDALDPPKALSDVQTRLREIAGTASGLAQVLADLGMSADEAAAAIRDRTAKAIDALKTSFDDDLNRKINQASGKDYLNSVVDLLKERQGLLSDAAALGTNSTKVEQYFTAAAQKIIDDSQLTGDAFTSLTASFPELNGRVHEFTAALDTAAAKAAAAARALGYQDRLFAATNDGSTLEGQLAAYDRKAQQEREAEAQAGGQAMVDLEAAQAAERLRIVKDYYQQEADARAQAYAQATSAYGTWARSIRDYVSSLKTGASSPLSPGDRLTAAQSAYDATLRKAQGGDRDALDAVTGRAGDLLDAAKAMYASTQGFQDIFGKVTGQLTALPAQVSPEQFLADTITKLGTDLSAATAAAREALLGALRADNPLSVARALSTYFGTLDTSLDGLLSPEEYLAGLGPLATAAEQKTALDVFKRIDLDGDGQISKLELTRFQVVTALQANSPTAIAAALSANFTKLDTSVNGLLDFDEFKVALGPLATAAEQEAALAIFRNIDADGDGQISRLEIMRFQMLDALRSNSPAAIAGALNAAFTTLTAATNGRLTATDLVAALGPLATAAEQRAALEVFRRIDLDGDGVITKLEASQSALVTALQANSPALIARALFPALGTLNITAGGALTQAQFLASIGPLATADEQRNAALLFQAIDANGDAQIDATELMHAQLFQGLQANSPALIARALFPALGTLNITAGGALTQAQFLASIGPLATKADQDRALAIFRNIDADGDGMLSALELLRTTLKAAIDAGSAAATAQALDPYFATLTSTTGGLLSLTQFQGAIGPLATSAEQQAARTIFDLIDANGDGQIDKLELVRAQTAATTGNTASTATGLVTAVDIAGQQKTLLDALSSFAGQTAAFTWSTRDNVMIGNNTLAGIRELSGLQRDQLNALNAQFSLSSPVAVDAGPGRGMVQLTNNMVSALNKIVFNTANTVWALRTGGQSGNFAYANGGWVDGPGTGTSDSIAARLSNGEFVVNAASARVAAPWLEAVNDNRGLLPAVPMPVPMPMMAGGGDVGAKVQALQAEVRSLRADLKALIEMQARVTKAAGDKVAATVAVTTEAVEDGNDDRRKAQRDGKTSGRAAQARVAA